MEVKLCIAGLGTVGSAVVQLLQQRHADLQRREGIDLRLVGVSARKRSKERPVSVAAYPWFDSAVEMVHTSGAQLFVELIGGQEGPALESIRAALAGGLSVVTANKALLAYHGKGLEQAFRQPSLFFEAAVGGAVPAVKLLRECLNANRIERVLGILNGTCNYILTTMYRTGQTFESVLAQAQELGYAEANPGLDIDGFDTAQKLSLLSSLAFGTEPAIEAMAVEGIRALGPRDLAVADEMGFRVKLLGLAQRVGDQILREVKPFLLDKNQELATLDGVYNAIRIDGDASGPILVSGQGAGGLPTASAVLADIVDAAKRCLTAPAPSRCGEGRGPTAPHQSLFLGANSGGASAFLPPDAAVGSYFIRMAVPDKPGTLASLGTIFCHHDVSVESALQKGRADRAGQPVMFVVTTHPVQAAALKRALKRLTEARLCLEPPTLLQIVQF